MLRTRLITHFDGLILDAVLAAPDRDYVGALLFPNLDACGKLCSGLMESAVAPEIISRPEVRFIFQARLKLFVSVNPVSSTHIRLSILLTSPLCIEPSESTDKSPLIHAAFLT